MCYMETVTHREMRNHSGEILRRVEAGESVRVSNNGRPVAVISPVGRGVIDELLEGGQARAPLADVSSLVGRPRRRVSRSSAEIVQDARGRW